MTEPFLPFAKPSIDEATIAAVAEVLRSGWLSGGPKAPQFEALLSDSIPAPARWRSPCASPASAPAMK
jgi:dTDP-4-amino-4,6-dideoxygalactose transaminase